MYKILVVEDEKILRDGICEELNSMGIFEISSASNGLEALQMMRQQTFDGIVLDIKMPKMDGLELLSQMSQENISPVKIVISGYDEFEYAQKAIKYGVIEYVLKPFMPQTLRNVGTKLCEVIKEKRIADREITRLREQVVESKPLLREKLLKDLTEGIDIDRFSQQAKYIGIEFPYAHFQIAVFKSGNQDYSSGAYEETLQIAFLALKNRIQSNMNESIICEPLGDNIESLAMIFNFEEPSGVFDICEDALRTSLVCKVGLSGLSVMGGISGVHKGLGKVAEAYSEATEAVRYNTMLAHIPLLIFTDIAASGDGLHLADDSKILHLCRMGMADELKEYILGYFDDVKSNAPVLANVYMAAEYIAILCCTATSTVTGTDISALIEQVRDAQTMESIYLALAKISDDACAAILKYRKHMSISSIEEAKCFVKENYANQISVVDVADHVQLSANYLGKLFKENEDINISDYINKVRIEKACELIRTTHQKNYQIAYAVGYNDPNYFSVVFKRVKGINPKEYRGKC